MLEHCTGQPHGCISRQAQARALDLRRLAEMHCIAWLSGSSTTGCVCLWGLLRTSGTAHTGTLEAHLRSGTCRRAGLAAAGADVAHGSVALPRQDVSACGVCSGHQGQHTWEPWKRTCGRARAGALDLRRLAQMLRTAPWRTPPLLALQGALGESTPELAVLRMERRVGEPMSFCTHAQGVGNAVYGNAV